MNSYFTLNEWSIIEENFHPAYNKITESVFSIGNGRMGQRANFEEKFSGETQLGHYVAGICYSFKNIAGTRQYGTSHYETRLVNAPSWIGIDVEIDGEVLDLATCKILDFRRELNMREGYLERTFRAQLPSGKEVEVSTLRFVSIADDELGAIRFAIMPLNFSGRITLAPYLNADILNAEANSSEKVWVEIDREVEPGTGFITAETRNKAFQVCTGMRLQLEKDGTGVETTVELINRDNYIANRLTALVNEGEQLVLYKYAAVVSSGNYPPEKLVIACGLALDRATQIGFSEMLDAQAAVWAEKWQESDIVIKGDAAAQQAIRFNIFQLHQTYTGEDHRLGIGRNGFTGEKYDGFTDGDTEAFCLPFYLATADQQVARNLLLYRSHHLPKGNPMATINGEEIHSDGEIDRTAIHLNGAIAYAIYDYCCHTGDSEFLNQHGLEVLIGISRFWVQRVNWSAEKNKYEIQGLTGPNEHERNVNINWYTATIINFTLAYTLEALQLVKQTAPTHYIAIKNKTKFDDEKEIAKWQSIINNIHYPVDEEKGIFLQHDNYLDLDQYLKTNHDPSEPSIMQQPDVLQGIYLFEDRLDLQTIRRNFNFYETRIGQESPVSTSILAILAAKIGEVEKAYDYFLQAARFNLDNYQNKTLSGCQISGMAASWQVVVKGFGGMRVFNNKVYFYPIIPRSWQSYTFKIRFQGHLMDINITQTSIKILNQADKPLSFYLYGKEEKISANNIGSFPRLPEKLK